MKTGRKAVYLVCICAAGAALLLGVLYFGVRAAFPRPYRNAQTEVEPALAYAVMKAESGFCEDAESSAGAVGLMQLLPATAEFVCRKYSIAFEPERLTEGEYNFRLGCLYLRYLLERFPDVRTALASYNAGEGTVSLWLKSREFSADGKTLSAIPYPETERYVKKVLKFRKIYRFFYDE